MKKTLLMVVIVLIFFGCRNHLENATKNITPIGLDTYTIAYSGRNYSAVKTVVYQAANQHCEKQGKFFVPEKNGQRPTATQVVDSLMRNNSVELVFRCVQPDDPEYTRTTGSQ